MSAGDGKEGGSKRIDKRRSKALAVRPGNAGDYEVGYARPPAHTRFKPGQSGNPRGRPKGSRNQLPALHEERLQEIILREAYRTIKVNDGSRQISVPMAQAIVRSLAVNAAKGNTRAQRLFSQMLHTTETVRAKAYGDYLEAMIEYKVEWDKELRRREQFGITHLPEPLPHPDDVHIDMRTGDARVLGPWTKEDKPRWDELRAKKAEFEAERERILAELAELEDDETGDYRQFLVDDLAFTEGLLEKLRKVLPRG